MNNIATIDVFISHTTEDDAEVSRIHASLTAAGISVWVDHERGITSGDNWDRAIHDAANACKYGLFVLSPNSAKSEYCIAEWNHILGAGKRLYIARLAPVPQTDVPLRIGTLQYADLSRDFDGGLHQLIEAMTHKRVIDPESPLVGQSTRLSGPFPHWQLDLPLIGREGDMAAVHSYLAEQSRVVAILGLGGVGKTRLAAQIAARATFADGVIWHEISDNTTLGTLTNLIRDHLNLDARLNDDRVWTLLSKRAPLIVLDNADACREPAAYAARLNTRVLDGGTRVLMTSRHRWDKVSGAKEHDLRAPSPEKGLEILDAMVKDEAPRYTPSNLRAELAEAAYYHPRLILYAVRWLKKYPAAQVLKTLQGLSGRDAQIALDDMVLKTVAQVRTEPDGEAAIAVLRRLTACRGGFTYEAAGAILGTDADLGLIGLLTDWGLVTLNGERYEIDPLVRAAVGEDESAALAHYEYYKAFANLYDKSQDYVGLDIESENLEHAFERALVRDPEAAFWMANTCAAFLVNRMRVRQRTEWFKRADGAIPTNRSSNGETQ